MIKIIQNAVRIIETGDILCSQHTHDFVCWGGLTGSQLHVDGGLDYLKRGGDAKYEELSLYEDSSMFDRIMKTVWGTRGPDGRQPLRHMLLRDAELDHLVAILDNCPLKESTKQVVKKLIELKSN